MSNSSWKIFFLAGKLKCQMWSRFEDSTGGDPFSSASLTHFVSFLFSGPMASTAQEGYRALARMGGLVIPSLEGSAG